MTDKSKDVILNRSKELHVIAIKEFEIPHNALPMTSLS
jgi:hypothetical protein